MGWRYLLFALGGMTLFLWAVRFFVFPLEESPRFLVGRGRDEEAVAVIQRIAKFNGRECRLTVDQLRAAGEAAAVAAAPPEMAACLRFRLVGLLGTASSATAGDASRGDVRASIVSYSDVVAAKVVRGGVNSVTGG